jgi:hypothetical protein
MTWEFDHILKYQQAIAYATDEIDEDGVQSL